jgi:hypothetical protein
LSRFLKKKVVKKFPQGCRGESHLPTPDHDQNKPFVTGNSDRESPHSLLFNWRS